MTLPVPLRYPGRAAVARIESLLNLGSEDWMQDWPLEVSDASRLEEFCDLYEFGAEELDNDTRLALMQLILYSLEIAGEELFAAMERRIERLLCRDFAFHIHTINYWRMAEEPEDADPEHVFPPTPLARRVWEACFRPEYQGWLNDEETPETA